MTNPDVTTPPKRLHILGDAEIEPFYGRPGISVAERETVQNRGPVRAKLKNYFYAHGGVAPEFERSPRATEEGTILFYSKLRRN